MAGTHAAYARNPDIRTGSYNATGCDGVLRFNHLHQPFSGPEAGEQNEAILTE